MSEKVKQKKEQITGEMTGLDGIYEKIKAMFNDQNPAEYNRAIIDVLTVVVDEHRGCYLRLEMLLGEVNSKFEGMNNGR